jgi:hypothetical protein
MRLSTSATICGDTKFSSISPGKLVNCTNDGAVVEAEASNNSVQHDAALHIDLQAVADVLHQGNLALTALNPAIVAVLNTMCVENGLVRIIFWR